MANTNLFPVDDVVKMVDLLNTSMYEVESIWTDEMLAETMRQFYAGLIVTPMAGKPITFAPPSQLDLFLEGSSSDIVSTLEQTADVTRSIASTVIEGAAAIPSLLKSLPLVAVIAAGVGIYLISRKA